MKYIKLLALPLVIVSMAHAGLILDVSPNEDGDWVLHLTGQYDGSGVTYYNSLSITPSWNYAQESSSGSFSADSVEAFLINSVVNSAITDPFDIGDGVVVGDTLLKGFHIDTSRIILKFDTEVASNLDEFSDITFDQTVILKPSDKTSFSDVWNVGTYVASQGLTVNVIPEPSVITLFGFFGCGLLWVRRNFRG